MNALVIKGRLTKDPEIRTTESGNSVCNFSVAVNRRFNRNETDFFECRAWNKTGDFVKSYFKKGQEILAIGEMQCRKWNDKDGKDRYSWEMIAEQVDFCGSKTEPTVTVTNNAVTENIAADDDLPF